MSRIEGLHGMNALTHLELNNNAIYRLEDINVLKKYTPGLYTLNLRNNQMCENKTYKGLVLRRLTLLTSLDGTPVRIGPFAITQWSGRIRGNCQGAFPATAPLLMRL